MDRVVGGVIRPDLTVVQPAKPAREMLYYLRITFDGRIADGGGSMGIVHGGRIRGRVLTSARSAEVAAHIGRRLPVKFRLVETDICRDTW